MIIGVSGKIGSGKDTVGKIIQHLTTSEEIREITPLMDWLEADEVNGRDYCWKVKKFAGKLKEIVSMFTGYSIKELESIKVKDTVLSDEWQVFELYNFGHRVTNRLTLLKAVASFDTEKEVQDFCDVKTSSQHQFTYKKTERTVRWLLQNVGTDAMREKIHHNVWVNALFADYKATQGRGLENHTWDAPRLPDWVITDVRFPNETSAIVKREGIVIRVRRPGKEIIVNHESETALDEYPFKYFINNTGTIEELVKEVTIILKKENLI